MSITDRHHFENDFLCVFHCIFCSDQGASMNSSSVSQQQVGFRTLICISEMNSEYIYGGRGEFWYKSVFRKAMIDVSEYKSSPLRDIWLLYDTLICSQAIVGNWKMVLQGWELQTLNTWSDNIINSVQCNFSWHRKDVTLCSSNI